MQKIQKLKALSKIAVFLLALFSGCSNNTGQFEDINSIAQKLLVSEKTFLAIDKGFSLERTKAILGRAAQHEFTVLCANNSYTLISCLISVGPSIDDAVYLSLLFSSKILIKIIELPRAEIETYLVQGTPASRIKSWDVEDTSYINKTIKSSEITRDQIQTYLADLRVNRIKGVNRVMPAFVLTRYFDKMSSRLKRDYQMNNDLFQKYNGCLAELGMTNGQIEALYGIPLRVVSTKSGGKAQIYGIDRELQVNPVLHFSGLAVVFDAQEHVTAIYSGAFFNDDWKKL